MSAYIIEHPRRGIYRELTERILPSDPVRARFLRDAGRLDERAYRAPSLQAAIMTLTAIPEPARADCEIRRLPDPWDTGESDFPIVWRWPTIGQAILVIDPYSNRRTLDGGIAYHSKLIAIHNAGTLLEIRNPHARDDDDPWATLRVRPTAILTEPAAARWIVP